MSEALKRTQNLTFDLWPWNKGHFSRPLLGRRDSLPNFFVHILNPLNMMIHLVTWYHPINNIHIGEKKLVNCKSATLLLGYFGWFWAGQPGLYCKFGDFDILNESDTNPPHDVIILTYHPPPQKNSNKLSIEWIFCKTCKDTFPCVITPRFMVHNNNLLEHPFAILKSFRQTLLLSLMQYWI